MKKSTTYILPLLFLLGACSQEELPQTPSPDYAAGVITFQSPYTVTRSAALRSGTFQPGDQVGVLGYCKASNTVNGTVIDYSTSDWNTKKVFSTPDVFYNQMLKYTEDGLWTYSWSGTFDGSGPVGVGKLHPWSSNEDDTFSFFAYYPYAKKNNKENNVITNSSGEEMGTITLSGENATGDPTITYEMPHNDVADLSSAKKWWVVPDFMLAYKVDHKKEDGSVKLNFRHLFCAFEFEINNYNQEKVIVEDLYLHGGKLDSSNSKIEEGFYKEVTITGQQSGYDINTENLYVGRFKIVGRDPNSEKEDEHILVDLTCPAAQDSGQPTTTSIAYDGSPISLLFIPDERGMLTTDDNESLSMDIKLKIDDKDVERVGIMNLGNQSFQPGVRSIFSINVIGNDIYVQMRSDGTWENDGDSDITFE